MKVHPPGTLIVVKVHMQKRRLGVGEPLAERPSEGGMAGIQCDAEALQIEVARRAEVRAVRFRHVLDGDRQAEVVLYRAQISERTLKRVDDLGIPRSRSGPQVRVHDVERRAQARGDLHVPPMQPHGGASYRLVWVPSPSCVNGPCTLKGSPASATARAFFRSSSE